ncbi:alpha-tocopherol transfer protein-like [Anticarsia gemmatalis]|uniref:alpha-tocopherol transfer protein-like n=1 Tax=Anticarsia gemmatalis TaxID=129554 RepID=UPI003F76499E
MPCDLQFNYDETTAAMDKFSQNDIDELRQWIQKLDKSKCVPKDLTDKQIVIFYNACYSHLEKTKVCIERYYSIRRNAPELFDHRVLNSEDMKQAAKTLEMFPLPGKTSDGYEILFHRLHDTDPSKFCLEAASKYLFMLVDLCLTKQGPKPGFVFLFDMRGVKFGHITRLSLTTLRKFFQYVQEATPLRMRAIHVLNTDSILDKLLMLIKPFMDKQFYDMIKFYNKNDDLEKLYEIIPKTSLPSDYGGVLPDTQVLHKECFGQLQLLEPYFKAEEEQRTAALPDKKNENTLEGTFKKLDID